MNGLLLLTGIILWTRTQSFNPQMMYWGLLGGFCDAAGKVIFYNALDIGPAGPINAVVGLCSIELLIIEAIINRQMLTNIELISILLSFLGSLILVIPGTIAKLLCFSPKVKSDAVDEDQTLM